MTILISGACGLLGAHLTASLSRRHDVVGIDRHPWWGDRPANVILGDLTASGFIADIVGTVAPDVLIHCAAMVDVDACEQNPELAYTYNAEITKRLARAVSPRCLFVYISTDGIFRGDTPLASEEQLPLPRTVYGRSKLHGEWEVQLATDNHVIVRTNFYGWSSRRKQTAAEWLYDALAKDKPITLFEDFFFTPIYVVDFVERLEVLISGGHRGMFHLAGGARVSKSQFGMLMAEAAGFLMEQVRRGSIKDAPLIASRPKDMSLESRRFCEATGLQVPGCMSGVRRFIKDRGTPLSVRFA